jgi:hypothetical protein
VSRVHPEHLHAKADDALTAPSVLVREEPEDEDEQPDDEEDEDQEDEEDDDQEKHENEGYSE